MDREELMRLALKAREAAYTPYSHYAVGAALLAADGRVFTGCNIENASYPLTNCAERTAFFKAVSEGVQEFTAIAICGGPEGETPSRLCTPCGACRQVMAEFCGSDFTLILLDGEGALHDYTLDEILPLRFGPKDLNG